MTFPGKMHEIASVKPGKFPRAAAIAAVRDILPTFELGCSRVIVAGSLRRRKQAVGDVEILYIPQLWTGKDLLGNETSVEITDSAFRLLIKDGTIAKRLNSSGHCMWGPKNKFAVHCKSGIPIDFFSATEENWFNYLVCRTGPMESNVAIAAAAQRQGLKWHPYGRGFTKGAHWIDVKSERDVFDIVGLPFREPWER